MPKVDGLGLLAISRRSTPERPVIVMTAYVRTLARIFGR